MWYFKRSLFRQALDWITQTHFVCKTFIANMFVYPQELLLFYGDSFYVLVLGTSKIWHGVSQVYYKSFILITKKVNLSFIRNNILYGYSLYYPFKEITFLQRGFSLDEMVIISFDNVVQFIIITMNVRFLMACPFSKEQKLKPCFKGQENFRPQTCERGKFTSQAEYKLGNPLLLLLLI